MFLTDFCDRNTHVITTQELTNLFYLRSSNLDIKIYCPEVVVAQLVERSHPTPEIRGWHPVIGEFVNLLLTVLKRRK